MVKVTQPALLLVVLFEAIEPKLLAFCGASDACDAIDTLLLLGAAAIINPLNVLFFYINMEIF